MKIAVTGGSGKAGRAVVRDLLEHGHEVLNVDVVPSADSSSPASPPPLLTPALTPPPPKNTPSPPRVARGGGGGGREAVRGASERTAPRPALRPAARLRADRR